MNVKQAAQTAKSWVLDLLSDENIFNVGIEEIEFDERKAQWRVTVGFSRPWNSTRNALSTITGEPSSRRAYRVLAIRARDGEVVSMKRLNNED